MPVSIFKLEDAESPPLCTLQEGAHSLGRGPALDCTDKRISRQHVTIVVEPHGATLALVHHTNPCYWRAAAPGAHMILLKPNVPVHIANDDAFGFFADSHWYRLQLQSVDSTTTILPEEVTSTTPSTEVKEEEVEAQASDLNLDETLREEPPTQVKEEPVNEETLPEELPRTPVQVKAEPVDESDVKPEIDAEVPSTSCTAPPPTYRDRCWYGSRCYRKNDEHKARFSHVGDADYDTDPEDTRPHCEYGRACYRRNSAHRRDFQHSKKATQKRAADSSTSPAKKRKCQPPARDPYEAEEDYEDEGEEEEDDPFDTDEDEDYMDDDDDQY